VEWLAGILRVADGLDCSHARVIGRLACDVSDKEVVIRLKAAAIAAWRLRSRKKQDLLEQKTGRRIEYRC